MATKKSSIDDFKDRMSSPLVAVRIKPRGKSTTKKNTKGGKK